MNSDRLKLKIELVPRTTWFTSLFSLLPSDIWKQIREEHIQKPGAKCEICNSTKGPFQLHEKWEYNDENHVQKLVGLQLLCRKCHLIKHIGLAEIKASEDEINYDELVEHFCRVSRCSKQDFEKHQEEAFRIWEIRSSYEWKQDFGEHSRYIDENKLKERSTILSS